MREKSLSKTAKIVFEFLKITILKFSGDWDYSETPLFKQSIKCSTRLWVCIEKCRSGKMYRKIPLKFQNTKYRGVPLRNWEATKIVDAFFSRKSVSNLLVLLIHVCSMLFQKTYNNCLKILNSWWLSNIFEDWYSVSKIVPTYNEKQFF